MVTRTRPDVTLYVHRLYCLVTFTPLKGTQKPQKVHREKTEKTELFQCSVHRGRLIALHLLSKHKQMLYQMCTDTVLNIYRDCTKHTQILHQIYPNTIPNMQWYRNKRAPIMYQIRTDRGTNVHRQCAKYVAILVQNVPTHFARDTDKLFTLSKISLGVTWYNGKSASPSKPWQNQWCVTHKNRFHTGDE